MNKLKIKKGDRVKYKNKEGHIVIGIVDGCTNVKGFSQYFLIKGDMNEDGFKNIYHEEAIIR